jgi:hypothetical protein
MRILLPKIHVRLTEIDGPLFFLMGPILGGGDWQTKACLHLLGTYLPGFTVVVPCRWKADHPLSQYFIEGEQMVGSQVQWERYWLSEAGTLKRKGCIIAWLPCEDPTHPSDDGQPYARDTYGELGEWRGHLYHSPRHHFSLGMEPEFPGGGVIRKNFDLSLGSDSAPFLISPTLETTISRAIEIAASGRRSVPARSA